MSEGSPQMRTPTWRPGAASSPSLLTAGFSPPSTSHVALTSVGESRLTWSGCVALLCGEPTAFRGKASNHLVLLSPAFRKG
jgi:hypothetical protein